MKERKERLPRLDILSAIKRGCPKRGAAEISADVLRRLPKFKEPIWTDGAVFP